MIFLGLFLTTFSCLNEKQSSLDQSKKDAITIEIETAINQTIDGWKTMNIKTAYPLFLNSPEFTFVGVDGSIMDYSATIEMSKSMFDSLKNSNYSLLEKRIKIVDQNFVIALIIYNAEMTYLNGTVEKYPKVGCTFVFSKINDKWVVTHFQESTLTPETIKPETK